jgi:hypothetical protein
MHPWCQPGVAEIFAAILPQIAFLVGGLTLIFLQFGLRQKRSLPLSAAQLVTAQFG